LHHLPRDLLSDLLSATPPAPIDAGTEPGAWIAAVDWQAVALDANDHALGPLVYRRLEDLGLTGYLPAHVALAWQADSLHAQLQNALQQQDAREISRALTGQRIRHAFAKGFAYRNWLYRPEWIRIGGDVDLLIDRENVERVRSVMHGLGFIQASGTLDYREFRPATRAEIDDVERKHHELGLFVRDYNLKNAPEWLFGPNFIRRVPFTYEALASGPVFHSCVDVHWALHFIFADADPLADAQMHGSTPERQLPILSSTWSILFSIFKLYNEAFNRPKYGLTHLIDLVALLHAGQSTMDWTTFHALVSAYQLETAAFYTLSAAERLAGTSLIPASLLARWSVFPFSQRTNYGESSPIDPGDCMPYVLGERLPGHWGMDTC
jgi:hypothetical protein